MRTPQIVETLGKTRFCHMAIYGPVTLMQIESPRKSFHEIRHALPGRKSSVLLRIDPAVVVPDPWAEIESRIAAWPVRPEFRLAEESTIKRAHYDSDKDQIVCFGRLKNPEAALGLALHEIFHAAGAAGRCDRQSLRDYFTMSAQEECAVSLAAGLATHRLGVVGIEDGVDDWLPRLASLDDERTIRAVVLAAKRAVRYLFNPETFAAATPVRLAAPGQRDGSPARSGFRAGFLPL